MGKQPFVLAKMLFRIIFVKLDKVLTCFINEQDASSLELNNVKNKFYSII